MKQINKYLVLSVLFAVVFSSCTHFLDNEPTGATVTQEQYDKNPNSLEAHVNGLYAAMIVVQDHDLFGQKSWDIKTDMIASDMALVRANYGWFSYDAILNNTGPSLYLSDLLWSYYYRIIKNANMILSRVITEEQRQKAFHPVTFEDKVYSHLIGEAYAMRSWCYYWLSIYYIMYPELGVKSPTLSKECVPYYDEFTPLEPQEFMKLGNLLTITDSCLIESIKLMSFYEADDDYSRMVKTNMTVDVAKGVRAYLNLYRAAIDDNNPVFLQKVFDVCDDIISTGKYPILPYGEVLSSGFRSVDAKNWMWGIDIDMESRGALASFWGQVDIFTYSYAYAGDVKAIDETLYNELGVDKTPVAREDIRKFWFNTTESDNLRLDLYKLAPTGKFYAKEKPVFGGDRVWVNDIVFMRSEEIYLLAAEAAAREGDIAKAATYLEPLVEQRDPNRARELSGITNLSEMINEIYFNWRVELWGEGKGYTTMNRMYLPKNGVLPWCKTVRTRGDNHKYLKSKEIIPFDLYSTVLWLPNNELRYNPYAPK